MRCRASIAVVAAVTVVLAGGSGLADEDHGRHNGTNDFVGLWKAIDTSDGSLQQLSITCARRSDCLVRLNDTLFALSCVPPTTGIAVGDGSIHGNVLEVDLTLTCTGASESIGTQANQFVLDRKQGTLTDKNNDDIPERLVFHRISR